MRRTFWALCTACVAIMRACNCSRTAITVAIHQSREVAEPVSRASVEVRFRVIEALKTATGSSEARRCGAGSGAGGADFAGALLFALGGRLDGAAAREEVFLALGAAHIGKIKV